MQQIIELVSKGSKRYIITVAHMPKKMEEEMDMQDRDTKDIKMIQTELLEKETAVTEMKNILDGINRLDIEE